MRILLIFLLAFSKFAFSCNESQSNLFLPYAKVENDTKYTLVFPVSDMNEDPMFISGLDLVIENVVNTELQFIKENGNAVAHFELAPSFIGSTTIISSYNFYNEDGSTFGFCANGKPFKLRDLLKNGESV